MGCRNNELSELWGEPITNRGKRDYKSGHGLLIGGKEITYRWEKKKAHKSIPYEWIFIPIRYK